MKTFSCIVQQHALIDQLCRITEKHIQHIYVSSTGELSLLSFLIVQFVELVIVKIGKSGPR